MTAHGPAIDPPTWPDADAIEAAWAVWTDGAEMNLGAYPLTAKALVAAEAKRRGGAAPDTPSVAPNAIADPVGFARLSDPVRADAMQARRDRIADARRSDTSSVAGGARRQLETPAERRARIDRAVAGGASHDENDDPRCQMCRDVAAAYCSDCAPAVFADAEARRGPSVGGASPEPRRYIVVVQAAEGYPAKRPYDGPAPTPPEPTIHSAVLADDYEAMRDRAVAENERLRAAWATAEAALRTQRHALVAERDALRVENERLRQERDRSEKANRAVREWLNREAAGWGTTRVTVRALAELHCLLDSHAVAREAPKEGGDHHGHG